MLLAKIGVKHAAWCCARLEHAIGPAIDPLYAMRYARNVRRLPRIDLADPRADHVRPLRMTLVACVSLSLGIAAALAIAPRSPSRTRLASSSEDPQPLASEVASSAHAPEIEGALDAGADAAVLHASKPHADQLRDAGRANAVVPQPSTPALAAVPDAAPLADEPALLPTDLALTVRPRDEPPAIAAPPQEQAFDPATAAAGSSGERPSKATHSPRPQVEPTTIAYMRCDGLERPGARFPCPRDRLFERRARQVMQQLSECPAAASLERGEIELRLQLSRWGGVAEVAIRGASPATERAVRTCAEPALRELTSTLRSRVAIVSLRFEVR